MKKGGLKSVSVMLIFGGEAEKRIHPFIALHFYDEREREKRESESVAQCPDHISKKAAFPQKRRKKPGQLCARVLLARVAGGSGSGCHKRRSFKLTELQLTEKERETKKRARDRERERERVNRDRSIIAVPQIWESLEEKKTNDISR